MTTSPEDTLLFYSPFSLGSVANTRSSPHPTLSLFCLSFSEDKAYPFPYGLDLSLQMTCHRHFYGNEATFWPLKELHRTSWAAAHFDRMGGRNNNYKIQFLYFVLSQIPHTLANQKYWISSVWFLASSLWMPQMPMYVYWLHELCAAICLTWLLFLNRHFI